MLTRRIIPCLDIKDGRVVKGTRFESLHDAGDPTVLAAQYSNQGADELVFLDITASQQNRRTVTDLVSRVAKKIDIPFTVGGGVANLDDARQILLHGADKVGINTRAVENENLITEMANLFGNQCVVVAIDAKRNYNIKNAPNKTIHDKDTEFWFEVYTYGGEKQTGIDAIQWARHVSSIGAGEILLTSIDRDGTHEGYDLRLCKQVSQAIRIPVIASGGCGNAKHMAEVLQYTDAALAASIFHNDEGGINTVKRQLDEQGIPVRL